MIEIRFRYCCCCCCYSVVVVVVVDEVDQQVLPVPLEHFSTLMDQHYLNLEKMVMMMMMIHGQYYCNHRLCIHHGKHKWKGKKTRKKQQNKTIRQLAIIDKMTRKKIVLHFICYVKFGQKKDNYHCFTQAIISCDERYLKPVGSKEPSDNDILKHRNTKTKQNKKIIMAIFKMTKQKNNNLSATCVFCLYPP